MDQRTEHDALAAQHAELQQALAISHATHLALQQHHQGQMEAWQTQRLETEQQHKQQLEELHKVRMQLQVRQDTACVPCSSDNFHVASLHAIDHTCCCACWCRS